MSISISEGFLSRDGSLGWSSSVDLIYYTFDESNEETAREFVLAEVDPYYNGYPLRSLNREQVNDSVYKWTANYGGDVQQVEQTQDPSTPPILEFTAGGGNVHITQSISKNVYGDATAMPGGAIDFRGAIGVELNDDGTKARVRGVEVMAPMLEYSYTRLFPNDVVDDSYINSLFNLCARTNNAPFFERDTASVLFKGARGTRRGPDNWEIKFDFAYNPNLTGLTIGGCGPFNKTGWQYLDTLYVSQLRTVDGFRILVPGQVTVHTVYYPGDFSALRLD
jgi:hypothetical protein